MCLGTLPTLILFRDDTHRHIKIKMLSSLRERHSEGVDSLKEEPLPDPKDFSVLLTSTAVPNLLFK
jgi:hypothetical protein